jgi:hypothetical protein
MSQMKASFSITQGPKMNSGSAPSTRTWPIWIVGRENIDGEMWLVGWKAKLGRVLKLARAGWQGKLGLAFQ